MQAAGLLGGGQRSRKERLGPTRAAPASISDAPRPDAEVVVADHDADAREVHKAAIRQGFAASGRLSRGIAPRANHLM